LDETQAERRGMRNSVLRGVRIAFGQSAVDCIVLDVSATGARIRVPLNTAIPEYVTLLFSKGEVLSAERQWHRGDEAGFSFERTESLIEEPKQTAIRIFAMVRAETIDEPMRLLRVNEFFGDPVLQAAAEEAEASLRRMKSALAHHAGPSP